MSLPRVLRLREDASRLLARLTPAELTDLWQRAYEPVGHDGYSAGGHGLGGSASADDTTSVERAVLARMEGKAPSDPVRQWADELVGMLGQIGTLTVRIDARRQAIAKVVGPPAPETEAKFLCVNCHEPATWPDRPGPKAGRCQACWWYRHKHGGEDRHIPANRKGVSVDS